MTTVAIILIGEKRWSQFLHFEIFKNLAIVSFSCRSLALKNKNNKKEEGKRSEIDTKTEKKNVFGCVYSCGKW
jgi:hypothetical protein